MKKIFKHKKIGAKAFSWMGRLLVLLLCLLLAVGCQERGEKHGTQTGNDNDPPTFEGVRDLEVFVGEGVAFRAGVRAIGADGEELAFTVDVSGVDLDTPGVYRILYKASDEFGNHTTAQATVTVKARLVTGEQLWAAVDPIIASQGYRGMTRERLCEDLYWYIKANMHYISTSDKSDWVSEAYRGLTEHTGDCFTYYAVARAFFERLGVEVLTVQRAPNVLPTTHYWLLVNMGTEQEPAYYHWDVCPHPMEYPLESILLTDAELLAYNEKVEHYYTFDQTKYPPTPIR